MSTPHELHDPPRVFDSIPHPPTLLTLIQREPHENLFYKQGISIMPESQFIAAGFSKAYYDNLKYIAHDEEAHVQLLTAAISKAGGKPVAACTYSFPYKDPKSFVTLASVLEGYVLPSRGLNIN